MAFHTDKDSQRRQGDWRFEVWDDRLDRTSQDGKYLNHEASTISIDIRYWGWSREWKEEVDRDLNLFRDFHTVGYHLSTGMHETETVRTYAETILEACRIADQMDKEARWFYVHPDRDCSGYKGEKDSPSLGRIPQEMRDFDVDPLNGKRRPDGCMCDVYQQERRNNTITLLKLGKRDFDVKMGRGDKATIIGRIRFDGQEPDREARRWHIRFPSDKTFFTPDYTVAEAVQTLADAKLGRTAKLHEPSSPTRPETGRVWERGDRHASLALTTTAHVSWPRWPGQRCLEWSPSRDQLSCGSGLAWGGLS